MNNKQESDELAIAKRELAFQKVEIETLAAELEIAKKELIVQNKEKQKRADELIIANKELLFQNEEKQKRADELIITNKELIFQYEEKRKLATELTIAYIEIKKTEEYLRDHIKGLEDVIFITSHKVRQPVAHILGIANLLDQSTNYTLGELKKIVRYIKRSAIALDTFTKELTNHMTDLEKKKKNWI